ncbi:YjjG family noncanonical pyrimidine nucleotidase [Phocaeicola barnesiae]|jgi:5'-nucleotidase|uniref:YjjG family noncanonical pyrimidine nucleotidase n=1 Tax=Phocaeicola barnesiae TaxID=376804 RepID=UPI00033ADDCD|nr:YjjG family noncanonical pyrimidine nucleotidase [Phocaeicola barnesiae]CDD32789.1 haloacid dehalogenase-like hydrolase [Bacteroides sp. CAG:714]MCF2598652.1 YjjG family noncanonical pyrimidine nucleotidase [Phocaeicola barnesiae]MDM8241398.1 YjjG family noncanonical pyrimidine nucleotidase [Phocaeicola barnesiae]MDM8252542.1 YjjG family noncanonical pyrimidine nucleotidase [Phocaeicola barnesiae]MDM8258153.1 YjjG family noncanonical pyrimidine nucleotidase [Phocaeicola barnesiae]
MEYRSIFIDLDDTLWAFTENARDTFEEMYHQYRFERYFQSFDHFMELYVPKNLELWDLYGRHEISKDELNARRFSYPLLQVGVDDPALVKAYSDGFFAAIPYKRKLMPHAMEALEYLSGKYRLYILSNGFRELQEQKMRSAGILHYFRKIVLSEDIGAHKPFPAIFNFAMSATQSEFRTSLMIGDNWKNDVAGARDVGMGQGYYCPDAEPSVLDFQPTFLLRDWKEIKKVL